MLEIVASYLFVATIVGIIVTLFDGGYTYKKKLGRMGTYTAKVSVVRRNGETGAHATGRIVTKSLFWPVLACVYIGKPLATSFYQWLTEEHEPTRPE